MVALDAVCTAGQLQAHCVPYLTRQQVAVVVLQDFKQFVGHCMSSEAGQPRHRGTTTSGCALKVAAVFAAHSTRYNVG
jgi:hypothetical protein